MKNLNQLLQKKCYCETTSRKWSTFFFKHVFKFPAHIRSRRSFSKKWGSLLQRRKGVKLSAYFLFKKKVLSFKANSDSFLWYLHRADNRQPHCFGVYGRHSKYSYIAFQTAAEALLPREAKEQCQKQKSGQQDRELYYLWRRAGKQQANTDCQCLQKRSGVSERVAYPQWFFFWAGSLLKEIAKREMLLVVKDRVCEQHMPRCDGNILHNTFSQLNRTVSFSCIKGTNISQENAVSLSEFRHK